MLVPALAWLFIQFAMSGALLGTPANAMQIEICSSFGVQKIFIDPATGEPVEQTHSGQCDWCTSFGAVVDAAGQENAAWSAFEYNYHLLLPHDAQPHAPLYQVAAFQSRAPPL